MEKTNMPTITEDGGLTWLRYQAEHYTTVKKKTPTGIKLDKLQQFTIKTTKWITQYYTFIQSSNIYWTLCRCQG